MATIHVVRHKVLVEGLSQRDVARQLGISRNTVAKYLEHSTPHRVEINPRPQPVQDVITPAVHRLLEAHRGNTTAKQRLTSPRLVELLQEQGIHAAPRTVRRVVAEYKRARREVHVPLHYTPGDLAQVDFFEIALDLQGKRIRAWMFLLRMMYSGRDAAWIYRFQDTTCFLDGHVRAFRHFGGVPHRIVYDNLKPAVQRHLIGSRRLLQPRFAALASHYLFEPVFARPYTGSDKGGVEARGKGIRLQHLTPIPSVDTLEHAGRALQERLDERARTRLRRRGGQPIAALWEEAKDRLLMLPEHPHDPGVLDVLPANGRQAKVRVRTAWYSVPSTWAGLSVRVSLYPDTVVFSRDDQRVVHPRQPANGSSIFYRHYLRELARKPQALRQVIGPLLKELGAPFDQVWRDLVDARGPLDAARVFKTVLAAILEQGEPAVAAHLRGALARGTSPLLALRPDEAPPPAVTVPAHLRRWRVEGPDLTVYNDLGREG